MKRVVMFEPRPAFERLHDKVCSVALFIEPLIYVLYFAGAGWESKVIKGNVVYIDHINKVRPTLVASTSQPQNAQDLTNVFISYEMHYRPLRWFLSNSPFFFRFRISDIYPYTELFTE